MCCWRSLICIMGGPVKMQRVSRLLFLRWWCTLGFPRLRCKYIAYSSGVLFILFGFGEHRCNKGVDFCTVFYVIVEKHWKIRQNMKARSNKVFWNCSILKSWSSPHILCEFYSLPVHSQLSPAVEISRALIMRSWMSSAVLI